MCQFKCHREVVGAIKSLLNARSVELKSTRVLHDALLMVVLLYVSKTMVCCANGQPQSSVGYEEDD